jgi:aryl-alcohol dehydrogenase-like predicted oxidoreductase
VFGWTVDESDGFRILDAFVSAGFNLIDTADTYSIWVPSHQGGESETILGRWLRESGCRREVLIATKVGMDMGPGGKGLSTEHIRTSVDASLRRLGTDYIDLYQAHEDDPNTPLEETLGTLSELLDAGTVRAIGVSNYEAARLEAALETSRERGFRRFESLQPRYNLMDRKEYEGSLDSVCRTNGLGVLPYASLAAGFLTGKYRSSADVGKSPRGTRVIPRLNDRGLRILAALDEVAGRLATTPASVAVAWLLSRPIVTAPIASVTSLDQLAQLLKAASLTLDRSSIRLLDSASE